MTTSLHRPVKPTGLTRRDLLRRSLVLAGLTSMGGVLSACGPTETGAPEGEGTDFGTVNLMLNWFADAERGPYVQLSAAGIDRRYGFEAAIAQGGPGIATIPPVAGGEFEYGVSQASDVLGARAEGIPVVAVFGGFDRTLFSILAHPDVQTIEDLNGKQFGVRPGQVWWPWLQAEYNLDDVEEIGIVDMAVFVETEDVARQAFVTDLCALPARGVEFTSIPLADLGFNPYTNVLITTDERVREQPDEVRAVVQACRESWRTWVEDDSDAREAVFEMNPEEDEGRYECARETLLDGDFILPGDQAGAMTEERWETLFEQLVSVDVLPEELDWQAAFTTEFLS